MVNKNKISGVFFSDEVNVIDKLYSPCLSWANQYVRDAGYFSSHIYQAMSKQVLDFILRDKGNHITLFTNIDIFPSDYDAIVNNSESTHEHVYSELNRMLEMEEITDPVKMLAAIVKSGQMTVYVSLRKRDEGNPNSLDHSKSGFFYNDGDKRTVAFHGSFNETFPAVVKGLGSGHKEQFSIYDDGELDNASWEMFGEKIVRRLRADSEGEFPKYGGEGTIIVKIEDIKKEQLPSLSDEDWDPENHKIRAQERSYEIYEAMDEKIKDSNKDNNFTLFDHQSKGLEAWRSNGRRGILEHATGSGKTFTAITAIRDHVESGLPALVLVPGKELLKQWHNEVEAHIPGSSILCVGDNHRAWKRELHIWLDDRAQPKTKRITIAIIQSARGDQFQKSIRSLKNCLVVVDECHRIGAPSYSVICDWKTDHVLGLSATPERYSDEEGTDRLVGFCGKIVHSYSIDEAMEDDRLCDYFYYVSTVGLTNDHEYCYERGCNGCEADRYDKQMERFKSAIARYLDKEGPVSLNHLPKDIQLLAINAKRILKKAHNKIQECADIIAANYNEKAKQFWLIYCEDRSQLSELKRKLVSLSIDPIYEFWSEAKGAQTEYESLEFDRQATLEMWESTGGIMLSIECLDEGVNIPCISHGIILASSKNPRQFIQRRGRLLRLSENKTHARIWDVLVVPDSEQGGVHTNYVLDEISRALTFSSNAENFQAKQQIQNIAHKLGLTLDFAGGDVEVEEEKSTGASL